MGGRKEWREGREGGRECVLAMCSPLDVPLCLQERDGCVNVLNSYRLDTGVDALLKENLTEV